jgi:hypothetical protein
MCGEVPSNTKKKKTLKQFMNNLSMNEYGYHPTDTHHYQLLTTLEHSRVHLFIVWVLNFGIGRSLCKTEIKMCIMDITCFLMSITHPKCA